jgi:MoaA/NifB/PqqE/SkfB family radical SAM enzyme
MPTSTTASKIGKIVLQGYDTIQETYDSLESGCIHIVGMNLTSECNYRCPYCFVGSENLTTSPDEMTTPEKLNAMTQAREAGAKVLIICGKGEPFADSAIWSIIEKASSLSMWTIIYTNGSLIEKRQLDDLYRANVSLMIKVDSLDSSDYVRSTGHEPPQNDIKRWVLELKEALPFQYYPNESKMVCRLGINAVVSKANKHSVYQLSQFCQKENILFSCRVVQKTGNAVRNWEHLIGNEQANLNKIAKECSMLTVSSQAPNGCCSIYRYGVTIENNGDVYMCPNSRAFQKSIGNVCEKSLKSLLEKRAKMYPLDSRPGYCFVRAKNK